MKSALQGKKDKGIIQETKPIEKTPSKENPTVIPRKVKNLFQIPGFQHYSALMKLRLIVSAIFLLCTVAMILLFVGGWEISAVLLLLGYFLLFILMVKLFTIKNL